MNNNFISRSEAEKLGATCLARRNKNGQLDAIISLDNAPTVPQGEWKRHDEWVNGEYVGGFYHVNCPCEDGYFVQWRMNYCGNCGAPMQLDD